MFRTDSEEVWAIINELKYHLGSRRKIAENDCGIVAFVEMPSSGSRKAFANVYEDGENIYSEIISDEDDCADVIDRIYSTFFDDEEEEDGSAMDAEIEAEMREDEINERDNELFEAACDFIDVLMKHSGSKIDPKLNIEEELVDQVAKWLHKKGIDVYHPMYLEDEESGDIDYYEFPYGELE